MESMWRRLYQIISGQSRPHRRRPRPPAPALRILRLERRRVLSADFSFGAGGLVLQGFDAPGGETLSISQLDTEYRFTLSNDTWETPDGALPNGVQVNGQTLAIDSSIVDQIVDGLTVVGNANSPLTVTLDQADFSWLDGPLNFSGIRSLNQTADTQFALGDGSAMEVNASEAGITIGSINIAGNLTITSFGPIFDGVGTEINVTGNASFISRSLHPAADFDGDGTVTPLDRANWTDNFGLDMGATTQEGDANGDGMVNMVDYVLWRDMQNQVSQPGGIFLADNATDQLNVSGTASFIAQDGTSRFDIDVGSAGTTQFGSLAVVGANVQVQEDSATVLVEVDATSFTLQSTGSITDAPGTSINVTGLATFNAGVNPITLGDNATDTTNFGQLNLSGGAVSVMEDSGTELTGVTATTLALTSSGPITDAAGTTINVTGLATLNAGANPITLGDSATDATNFGQLHLTGGAVSVFEDSGSELTSVTATTLNLVSNGPITDAPGTTISVTGLATLNAGGNPITLGESVGDTTNFGQLHLTGGAIAITEDSGTDLTGVTATTLNLISNGPITDAPSTAISVTGLATLNAGGNPITLGDNAADTTNFGQLNVTGGVVTITEDSGTELTGVSATALTLTSAGPISDSPLTTISVTGLATLNAGANPITLGESVGDTTNFGQLHLTGGAIAITEDSGTELTGVSAASLSLTSAGAITDANGTTISVTGLATLNAGANSITLGDNVVDTTNFGQLNLTGGAVSITEDSGTDLTGVVATTFALTSSGPITDAAGTTINVTGLATLNAGANPITLGDNAGDTTNFGQLNLTGAAVTITEDSGTELTGVMATTLTLTSGGPISDAAATTINVLGLATLNAGANFITLGDSVGDTTNFGQLNVTGGAIAVTEDSATVLTGVSATTLNLISAGSITDANGTTISVTGLATLNAGANPITLGDNAGDTTNFGQLNVTGTAVAITEDSGTELTGVSATTFNLTSAGAITDAAVTTINVTGLATLNAGANPITLGDSVGDTTNFGQLHLTGSAVSVAEDSSTELTGVTAYSLVLTSAGAITDAPNTAINVTTTAAFNAGGAITLSDNATDVLSVGGLATFSAPTFNITIGSAGTTNFGSLNLNGAAVSVQEDSDTELTGVTANSLALTSSGAITDAPNTTINVTTTATFNAGGALTLADNAADVLSVGGLATFSAPTFNITIGPAGTANFGSLNLNGAAVSVQEDSATELTGVTANSLVLTSAGAITDAPNTAINITTTATFNAGGAITFADNAGDVLSVGTLATFSAPTFNITIGPAGTANFGSLSLNGAAVSVQEDSATELTGVTANSLVLTSASGITDAPNTAINVTTTATFNAGAAITLADNAGDNLSVGGLATFNAPAFSITIGPAGKANFGSLHLNGTTVTVQEDSSTELTGITANSLSLTSAGAITDAPNTAINIATTATFNAGGVITLADNVADVLSVGGLATFSAPTFNITIGPAGAANFGSLNLNGAAVTVQEDSSTLLTGISANSLALTSAGAITDAPATAINVTTTATFNAGGAITLSDNATDVLSVGGLATFSAPTFDIAIGPAGTTNFGSLNLTGAAVTVQEDSSTLLTGVTAASLSLTSAGAITDAPVTTIAVTGLATFNAGANPITLGDSVGDTTNFGQLNLTGTVIAVTEDSGTELTGISATSLVLTSAGSITDAPNTAINVATTATFNAGGAITLADNAGDVLSVGGLATFSAPTFDIEIGPAGLANFGSLHLTGKDISVQEDSATDLSGVTATSLALESAGAITDSATAVIFVNGPASMLANGKITLADMGLANSLIVVDLGSFQVTNGNNIDIGVVVATGAPAAANAQLGGLQFTANALLGVGGQVRVALDGPIILSGSGGGSAAEDAFLETTAGSGGVVDMNKLAAGSLAVKSDAAITDAPESDVNVTRTSTMLAKGPITLADQGPTNEFEVGGHASFTSSQSNAIDLGVVPVADPTSLSRGAATTAKLALGSVSFVTGDGDFTANVDNSVVLANMSLASSAWIQSAGSLTDAFGADTTVTQFAILKAADGSDIVLGDDSVPGDTRFRMDTPSPSLQVFDANRFLALKAEDVSIQADSGFNLRTGPNDSVFPGTVFLQATGNISQVGHEGNVQPLEANRIAMLSAAAVLFSQVRVNSQVSTDGTTPANLAIHGGAPLPVSVLPPGEFPINLIPSSTVTSLSPIGFDPAGNDQVRPDGSGLIDRAGAQILEPSPIGDGYSIIMKVLGDAKVGIVQDATDTQADLTGVEVNTAGNVFLQTVADDGGGSGGMAPPVTPEVGNIVFTSRGAPTETVVQMAGGIFTAVAAAKLTIDTDQPGAAIGAITTKLTSATGTVTSVEAYTTYDGSAPGPSIPVAKIGPRLILDAPTEEANAATTGLVLSPDFEQRLTMVAGSRGENNLVLELAWADVLPPPGVPGSNPNPDVTIVPQSIEGQIPQSLQQSSVPPLDFRVVTVRHEYAGDFIPENPALPKLPTTVRLYNDPAINLYDQGGARDLNVVENFVEPRVIAVPTAGFYQITGIELPEVYDAPDQVLTTVVAAVPQDRVSVDEIRVTGTTEVDEILYGRVYEEGENEGKFRTDEGWPLTWEKGAEGDYINEIQEAINESASLEGKYRIERSEQSLEEWEKGDVAEEAQLDSDAAGAAEEEQQQAPQDETDPLDEPAAMNAPSSDNASQPIASREPTAIQYRTEPVRDHRLAGQMLVGASALVVNRWSRHVAAEPSRDASSADFSRAARRRRAWHRLRQVPIESQ